MCIRDRSCEDFKDLLVQKGYRASLWTVGAWGLLINLAFVLAPGAIAGVFLYEPEAIKTAVDYLVIVGFSEAFLCVELTTVGALSGLGRTKLCSIISIIFTSARTVSYTHLDVYKRQILGYGEGPEPAEKPRKDDYIVWAD